MKKLLYSVLGFTLFFVQNGNAQVSDSIHINNIVASFRSNGSLFQDTTNWAKFQIKDANRKSAVFTGSLWMGGVDDNQEARVSVQEFYNPAINRTETDYSYGPICTDTNRYTTAFYKAKYNRVWKITQSRIDVHRANWFDPNYIPYAEIMNWPAHGDTTLGEPRFLAPFGDVNGNKIYEPLLGDYPIIRGDQAVFMIFNDEARPNPIGYGKSLQAEIHLMAYAFDRPNDSVLNNLLFLHYKIFNRGGNTLGDFRVGHFTDFDLGFAGDDVLGSDSIKNYAFCYNADNEDEGSYGFGLNPPAIALVSLNKSFTGSSAWYSPGIGTPNLNTTNPSNANEVFNYLNNKWLNGSPFRVEIGGDGYSTDTTLSETKWMFNAAAGWNSNPTFSRDTRIMPTQGINLFEFGKSYTFDAAYLYARHPSDSSLFSSVNLLANRIDSVHKFFTEQNFPCLGCNIGLESTPTFKAALFPNPFNNTFRVQTELEVVSANLYNSAGQSVYSAAFKGDKEIEITPPVHLDNGLYILTLVDKLGRLLSLKIQKL